MYTQDNEGYKTMLVYKFTDKCYAKRLLLLYVRECIRARK
jgi:hypothetical protein